MRIRKPWHALFAVALFAFAMSLGAQTATPGYSREEVRQAFGAIENADDYPQLLAAVTQHEALLASAQVRELVDQLLDSPQLSDAQRKSMQFAGAIVEDAARYGAETAAQLSAIRYIALAAMAAETPEQLAAVLDRLTPLSRVMNAQMVRAALQQPAGRWPDALLPLMEQLGQDWPAYGAQAAATRMAAMASADTQAGVGTAQPAAAGTFEDRAADSIINMGESVPDGLIYIPND
jgi:hypothetical protein